MLREECPQESPEHPPMVRDLQVQQLVHDHLSSEAGRLLTKLRVQCQPSGCGRAAPLNLGQGGVVTMNLGSSTLAGRSECGFRNSYPESTAAALRELQPRYGHWMTMTTNMAIGVQAQVALQRYRVSTTTMVGLG